MAFLMGKSNSMMLNLEKMFNVTNEYLALDQDTYRKIHRVKMDSGALIQEATLMKYKRPVFGIV